MSNSRNDANLPGAPHLASEMWDSRVPPVPRFWGRGIARHSRHAFSPACTHPASTPFLLLLCNTRSPQPSPRPHLRRASHTTHTPSTAFSPTPVGAADNHGRISPFAHRFSNCPHSHSRVLENSHPSQLRVPMHLRPDSHFSYRTYGYCCLFFISTHTYPPLPVALSLTPDPTLDIAPSFSRFLRKGWEHTRTHTHTPAFLLVFQKCRLVFHAPFHRRIATIGLMNRRRFRLPASCCTVRA